ncbi:MAG: hypothetical protein ABJB40_08750 [Acidobacteriota bacterium]
MNNRDLNNETLDMIGRKLVEAGSPRSNEIEKVISNPHLFVAIKRTIAADEAASSNFRNRNVALAFIMRNAAAFAAGVLILFVGAFALRIFRSEKTLPVVSKVPDAIPEVARSVFPPQGMDVGKLSAGRAFEPAIQPIKSLAKTVSTRVERKEKTRAFHEPANEFYAISTSCGQDDGADGSRIVRVDVPRSSLFALGINIPLENDAEVVKADLLIGSDGVTRAIRVVK